MQQLYFFNGICVDQNLIFRLIFTAFNPFIALNNEFVYVVSEKNIFVQDYKNLEKTVKNQL